MENDKCHTAKGAHRNAKTVTEKAIHKYRFIS